MFFFLPSYSVGGDLNKDFLGLVVNKLGKIAFSFTSMFQIGDSNKTWGWYISPPWVVLNWGGSFYAPKPCIWWRNRQTSLISLQINTDMPYSCDIHIYWSCTILNGWMILFVLPTCHPRPLNGVPAAPPPRRKSRRQPRWRPRRRMRLGDVEVEIVWGKLSNIYQHTCLYVLKFIYIYTYVLYYMLFMYIPGD